MRDWPDPSEANQSLAMTPSHGERVRRKRRYIWSVWIGQLGIAHR